MPVVVSWPGGVFPGDAVVPRGGKRKTRKASKAKKSKKTRKGTRKSRCWSRRA
jgi:hypothetical protein